ncbi:hypothetical protein AFB00_04540 [Pseudonocardia sp. HH130630-07]|nr:hypothetical protein AFB00_04540 [Pseudonocardia sp. HH130630-07]
MGSPQRNACPGSDALSIVGPTGSDAAIASHWNAVGQPATATPSTVAAAAAPIPVAAGPHRRWTTASSSSGASDGFSATVTP